MLAITVDISEAISKKKINDVTETGSQPLNDHET